MDWLRELRFKFLALFRRRRLEDEMAEEIRAHLELDIAAAEKQGLDPLEARYASRRNFGGIEQIKEQCRDARGARWLDTTLQDLKFAFRSLRRARAFTLAALAIIAVGIGANTSIFSFVNAVLLKPEPYPEPERIVHVQEKVGKYTADNTTVLTYLDWAQQNTVFQHIAASFWDVTTLTRIDEPVQIPEQRVTTHFFDIFRLKPELGRTFVAGEDTVGRDHVVILTNRTWRTHFGADPAVIGRKIILDGEANLVIGVMPAGSLDRAWAQIFRPLAFASQDMSRDFHRIWTYALLKPGVSLEQARVQLDAIGKRIGIDHPDTNKDGGAEVIPNAAMGVSYNVRQSLWVLIAASAMLLLIGCANLANLILARSAVRAREVAIRAALGAGRSRLVRQFLTESLLLSSAGSFLGLLIAYASMGALKASLTASTLPPTADITIDGRVLLFTLGLSLLTGTTVGLIPALKASRPDLTRSIKEDGTGVSLGRGLHNYRSALVIAEVALAFVLLSGAGLLIQSFFKMQQAPLGFDSTNLITTQLPIAAKSFRSETEFGLYLHRIIDRIDALPGVRATALTNVLPMQSLGFGMYFQVLGGKPVDPTQRPTCIYKTVSPSYFRTLGVTLLKGRLLNDQDIKGATPVIVINEVLARRYFPHEDPVGKHLLVSLIPFGNLQFGPEISWEIVGVTSNERLGGLRLRLSDSLAIYIPQDQGLQMRFQRLVIRGTTDAHALIPAIRKAVREINPDQALDNVQTIDEIKTDSIGTDQLRTSLLSVFGVTALALATIGLFGVVSYSVTQRTREIGIRTALGATSTNIVSLVVRSGMTLTGLGLVIGLGTALGLSRLLASMLFDVAKNDPVTLCATGGILALAALLACLIPARRASKVDPITALRCE